MREKEAHQRLIDCGVRPSIQRLAIMEYLLTHFTHPTVEDVYQSLCDRIPKLSRTTVYNTLRLFSEHHVAQMITIDDHHVCYDGTACTFLLQKVWKSYRFISRTGAPYGCAKNFR